jgi:hypothetical protein
MDPRKDGSLEWFARKDKPQAAWSKTLRYGAKGKALFGVAEPALKVRERRRRQSVSIAWSGRPLEGRKPRRASAAVNSVNAGHRMNGLAGGTTP